MKNIVAFGILILLFISGGCSHPTDPADHPRKDPRTYTWTIDTIYLPNSFQTAMNAIWGSSPKDVYVAGHNSNNPGQMYHYDGKAWTEVNLYRTNGGVINIYVDVEDMIGFSSSDIWAASQGFYGEGGHIIHYDGKAWTTVPCPYVKDVETFSCIGGTGPNNLWVGGLSSSCLYHYNGTLWSKDSLPFYSPKSSRLGDGFGFRSIVSDTRGNTYALATMHYQINRVAEIHYFLSYKNNRWTVIDSATIEPGHVEYKWGYNDLWVSPSNTVYSAFGNVYKMTNGTWTVSYEGTYNINSIGGSADDNIYAVGDFGTLLHFNGTDWKKLPGFSATNLHYMDVWTDGTEVFIVGIIGGFPQKSIVIHGK
ncbi:MAG: hypothetical protein ACM3Q4_15200 [Acidobacteriota bacterium]